MTFTLSGKVARTDKDALKHSRKGLLTIIGDPPNWPQNTAGTFTLSTKVSRVTDNPLGRIWPDPWATDLFA